MIYRFKSQAAADVIMMAPQGDQVLRLIGKHPSAQGVIQVKDLPAAIEALKHAVDTEESHRHQATPTEHDHHDAANAEDSPNDAVSLRQRVWPMVLMMTESLAEQKDVVWGV